MPTADGDGATPIGPPPKVIGSLGPVPLRRVEAAARAAGIDVPPVVEAEGLATLYVAQPASPCVGVDGTRASWALSPFGDDRAVLEVDGAGAALRGDEAGVVPLYYRFVADGVLFGSRVDDLVRVGDGDLHADWSAWAGILTASLPVGDRTPFEEIRRLLPDRYLSARDGRVRSAPRTWAWTEIDATAAPRTEEILGALREAITPLSGAAVTLPLSGGWDSRLLGALLAEQAGTRVEAITVDTDVGHRNEQRFAAAVAGQLGFPHRIATPRTGGYVADAEQVMRALDFQTGFHVWGIELQRAHAGDRPVIDGLAGGVLLKNPFVSERLAQARSGRERLDAVWRRLSASLAPGRLIGQGVAEAVESEARADFRRWSEPLVDHPADAKLAVYGSRTLRAIALATSQLWGTTASMVTPYIVPDVARLGLALPTDVDDPQGAFRDLLASIDPVLVDLPSTNTSPAPSPVHPRRELSPEAHAWYRRQVCHEAVAGLLAPGAVGHIRSGGAWLTGQGRGLTQPMRGLAVLSTWLQVYGDVLADASPPWSERRSNSPVVPARATGEVVEVALDADSESFEDSLAAAAREVPTDGAMVVTVSLTSTSATSPHYPSSLLSQLLGAGLQPDGVDLDVARLRVTASRGGEPDALGPTHQLVEALEGRLAVTRRNLTTHAEQHEAHLEALRQELQAATAERSAARGREAEIRERLREEQSARRALLASRWWRLGRVVAAVRRPNRWRTLPRQIGELLRGQGTEGHNR